MTTAMNVRLVRQRWMLACCAFILATGAILGAGKWLSWSFQQKFDLGNKPPSQVFARIFHMPVPVGISNMKVAGEFHLSGVFWMRFNTNNVSSVISALKRNPVVPVIGPTNDPNGLISQQDVVKDPYAASVGWNQALLIKNPEYYEFSTKPSGTGWWGVLIVDRTQNIIYARGELL